MKNLCSQSLKVLAFLLLAIGVMLFFEDKNNNILYLVSGIVSLVFFYSFGLVVEAAEIYIEKNKKN